MNTIKFYHRQKEYIVQSQNINQHTFNKNYNKVLALLNSNEIKVINECEMIMVNENVDVYNSLVINYDKINLIKEIVEKRCKS